ncbi:PREDICTED: F-box/kelch-repeat At3g06240 [Prunus dulcis]|uniref:PREDICTED: F-box/kelch-repeat At3g06240 n=1 Tax=Prunus dulcis TaxID=3755 RepID=A0A5E4FZC3_PRUDU|nr:hypothetical protein L3X38_042553 [Prunus dulcis]VVA32905.1 PREDICTED: F-box/kelch-repeat At3g06240 [Prunus dulcis]
MKPWETPSHFLGVGPGSVGAWEHGIFLRDPKSKNMVVFLDVDSGGIRAVQVGSSSMSDCDDLMPVDVFSYTGGYISLRKYGDLMEPKTGEGNFFSVGKMMQRSQAADSIRLCGFEKPELVETASRPLELNENPCHCSTGIRFKI